MAGDEKLFNQVVGNLRACLISAQGGIPLTALNNDYRQLLGEAIPFRKLGFASVENLIQSIPEVVLRQKNGELHIEAKASETSKHISKLVEKQKKASSGRARKKPQLLGQNKSHSYGNRSFSRFPVPPRPINALIRQKPNGYGGRAIPPPRVLLPTPSYPPLMNMTQVVPIPLLESRVPAIRHQKRPSGVQPTSFQVEVFNPKPIQHQTPPLIQPQPLMAFNVPKPRVLQVAHDFRRPPYDATIPGFNQQVPLVKVTSVPIANSKFESHRPVQTFKKDVQLDQSQKANAVAPIPDPFAGRNPAQKRLATVTPSITEKKEQPEPPPPTPLVEPKVHRPEIFEKGKLTTIQEKAGPCIPGGFVAKLLMFTQVHGWPEPNFILLPRWPKQSQTLYTCRVTILCQPKSGFSLINECNDYSTFPDEFVVADEAKERVARIAYNDLSDKMAASNVPCPVTKNENTITTRIIQLVHGQKQGIWAFKVEQDYRNLYDEVLPPNWIEIIKSSTEVTADKLADTSYIIRPKSTRLASNGFNIILPTTKQDEAAPPEVIPPQVAFWDVFINRAVSMNEVWLRFVGEEYSVLYESLSTDMEMHYLDNSEHVAPRVEVDKFYACQTEEGTSRVKVLSIDGEEAMVKFIDHGDLDRVPLSSLCVLDMRFSYLPCQALKCKLSGLDKFSESLVAQRLLVDAIEGKVLVAEVVNVDDRSVVLHDTSSETPLNVNNHLIELVGIETYRPTLSGPSSLMEAVVSGCNPYGDVYLQVSTDGLNYIIENFQNLSEDMYTNYRIKDASCLREDKVYLVIPTYDRLSYRATIVGLPMDPHCKSVDVFLIDYGRTMNVLTQELFDLENISDILSAIPPQIIRVNLKDLPPTCFNKEKAMKLEELAPQNEIVLVKVEEQGQELQDNVPIVELFKRMQPNNILVSINNTIKINTEISLEEIKKVDEEDFKIITDLSLLSPKKELSRPPIPDIDEKYFDVFVVEAANPSNFTVQPLNYAMQFTSLMSEMQNFYNASSDTKNIPMLMVQKGVLCSALDKKGYWCRAIVDTVLGKENVSVRYCDYGNIEIAPISNLRYLNPKFTKLPAIGFCAKITGISPMHGDWNVEDCVRLQELIEGKKLVSIIKEKIPDPKMNNQYILGLQLIDTNSDTDLDVGHELVMERRAKYI